jgi:hypothetical protein
MTDYIVDTGNWKVKVAIEDKDCNSPYMEAATQAVEAVFGMKELNAQCELISLVDDDGLDYFDPDCTSSFPAVPMFSIVTLVCKAKDMKTGNKYIPLLTRKVFENASQPINVQYALEAESLEPEKVKQFLKLEKRLQSKKTKKKD